MGRLVSVYTHNAETKYILYYLQFIIEYQICHNIDLESLSVKQLISIIFSNGKPF